METVIRKLGNSKGVIIPATLLKELGLDVNDTIHVTAEKGCIVLEPLRMPKYSLEDLLSHCNLEAMTLNEEDKAWLNETPVGKELL